MGCWEGHKDGLLTPAVDRSLHGQPLQGLPLPQPQRSPSTWSTPLPGILHTMTGQGIRDWKCWPSMRHPDRLELLMGPLEVAGLGLPQAAFCPTLLLPPLSLQVWPWANPLMHILHKKHCLKECASRRTKHATPTNIIDLWVDCSKRTPQKSSENKVPFCRFRNLHKPGRVTPVLEGQTRSLLSS